MPIFDIKQKESEQIAKATFDKKDDYMVISLVNDPLKKPRLVHKIQGERMIGNKKAVAVKDAKLQEREVETIVTTVKAD